MKKIGFVGLGAMGSKMAPLPSQHGFSVTVFDISNHISEPPGVGKAKSLEDLVNCEAVITMLPDGRAVTDVSTRIAKAGFRGIVIDMSSSHPMETISLGANLDRYGVHLIDAPVSGGVKKAEAGTLMIMVGGKPVDLANATKLISCFGTVKHVGPLGAGHAMKALNNYVSAAGLLSSMQALATAQSFGVTPDTFTAVINGSTGRNNTTEVKMMQFIAPRHYESGFFLRLMAKDVSIASELMENAGFDAPITPALNNYLTDALEKLGHNVDHTGLYEMVNPSPKN